jgi:hypothetical protein
LPTKFYRLFKPLTLKIKRTTCITQTSRKTKSMNTKSLLTLGFIIHHSSFILSIHAQSTAFTYQGRLNDGGSSANGTNDFTFAVFATASGGLPVAGPIKVDDVPVSNGLFTATVDFGAGVFTGTNLWLEIGVRPGDSGGGYTDLAPRQPITPTPYAIHAASAALATYAATTVWAGVNGVPPGFADGVDNDTTYSAGNHLTLTGTEFDLNTALTDGRYWTLFGNSGTSPGPNFLGTTDNQPLELKVNNTRALRLEPQPNSPNVIGGHSGNVVDSSAYGATIGGGGTAVEPNRISAIFSTVGGGLGNTIHTDAWNATIGGGESNTLQPAARQATISGGGFNTIESYASDATIGGGNVNTIQDSSRYATISGGLGNSVHARSTTISGGQFNTIETGAGSVTVSGGGGNMIQAGALNATIGGGAGSTIATNAQSSTIGGGVSNTVSGSDSVVAGGSYNLAGGPSSTVSGGLGNRAVGFFENTIGGGESNYVAGSGSTIAGGRINSVEFGISSAIAGGHGNKILSGYGSAIGGGFFNYVSSNVDYATISGGSYNRVQTNAAYAAIPGGTGADAKSFGQLTHSSGPFDGVRGSAQSSIYLLRNRSTNNTDIELFLDGFGQRMVLPTEGVWTFLIHVSAISESGNDFAAYEVRGAVAKLPSGIFLQMRDGTGATVTTAPPLYESSGAVTWQATPYVDVGTGSFRIAVNSAPGQTVKWLARVQTVEIVR